MLPQKRSCNCKVKYKLKSQALIKGRHLKRPFLTTFGTLTHSSFFGPNWWRCQDLYAKRILCSGWKKFTEFSSRYCIDHILPCWHHRFFIRHVACSFLCLNTSDRVSPSGCAMMTLPSWQLESAPSPWWEVRSVCVHLMRYRLLVKLPLGLRRWIMYNNLRKLKRA